MQRVPVALRSGKHAHGHVSDVADRPTPAETRPIVAFQIVDATDQTIEIAHVESQRGVDTILELANLDGPHFEARSYVIPDMRIGRHFVAYQVIEISGNGNERVLLPFAEREFAMAYSSRLDCRCEVRSFPVPCLASSRSPNAQHLIAARKRAALGAA